MSDDLIKRSDAIGALLRMDGIKIDKALAMGEMRSIPSADRPQGEWIISYTGGIKQTECSACGVSFTTYDVYGWHYCPWCGAKMDGERKESE